MNCQENQVHKILCPECQHPMHKDGTPLKGRGVNRKPVQRWMCGKCGRTTIKKAEY